MDDDTNGEDGRLDETHEEAPSLREAQEPIGQYGTSTPDDDDPQREEAAERASKAVEPGRERE